MPVCQVLNVINIFSRGEGDLDFPKAEKLNILSFNTQMCIQSSGIFQAQIGVL